MDDISIRVRGDRRYDGLDGLTAAGVLLLRALLVFAFGLPTAAGFLVLVEPFLGPGLAFVAVFALGADFLGAAASFLGAAALAFFAAAGFLVAAAGLAGAASFFANFTVPDGPGRDVRSGFS